MSRYEPRGRVLYYIILRTRVAKMTLSELRWARRQPGPPGEGTCGVGRGQHPPVRHAGSRHGRPLPEVESHAGPVGARGALTVASRRRRSDGDPRCCSTTRRTGELTKAGKKGPSAGSRVLRTGSNGLRPPSYRRLRPSTCLPVYPSASPLSQNSAILSAGPSKFNGVAIRQCDNCRPHSAV